MNFRDYVARDNLTTFINVDEFGEPVFIRSTGFEPQQIDVVIDRDQREGSLYPDADGSYASKITLYMRLDDLGYVPVENQVLEIGKTAVDLNPYIVRRVSSEMGILAVEIEASLT
jgi:hypothetical protein